MERICRLEQQAGRRERCPEDACPFWEPGGAVLDGRCAFERLDFGGRPEVAAELLHVRRMLEAVDPNSDEREIRRRFYRLLNDSD